MHGDHYPTDDLAAENERLKDRIDGHHRMFEPMRQKIELLRAALEECAAEWQSEPGTVMGTTAQLGREFKRRMEVAAAALERAADAKD